MMFKFIVLILAFMVSARAELPPTRAAGQGESLKPAFNLYFPPSTVSDMGGINKFIDTGSENLLVNSGFEAQTVSSGWTISNATASAGAAFRGLKSLSLSLTGLLSLSQEITATQYYPNVVSFSLWVKSSITDIQLCSTLATVEQECVDYDGSNQWKKLQVLVTAPSSGAMGLKLKTLSTTSGTILVDAGEFSSNPLKFASGVVDTEWVSYTPTISAGFGTTSNESAKWRRVGDSMEIIASFTVGTVAASIASFSLPSGYEIDASKLTYNNTTASSGNIVGHTNHSQTPQSATFSYVLTAPATSATLLYFSHQSNSLLDKTIPVNGSNLTTSGTTFTFIAKIPIKNWKSKSDQILTANDVVSSETINWQFKSTAITDCGGADAIGKYNTYDYTTNNSNTQSICGTAPTVVTPSNASGLYVRGESATRTTYGCAEPSHYRICIGKGLKGVHLEGYRTANQANEMDILFSQRTSTTITGVQTSYNEKTGLLIIDTGYLWVGTESVRYVGTDFPSSITSETGYIHFAASKNPVISALDAVPRIDYSWENEFSAKIDASAGGCSVKSQNSHFIDSCSRTGTGQYTVTWVSGFFTQNPSVVITVVNTNANGSISGPLGENANTTDARIYLENTAGTLIDGDFEIHVSRQGSDYRSRGDAAAIIAQPTCYVKDVKANGTPGGNSANNTFITRDLNTLEGKCDNISISSNVVTISEKGTWKINAKAPCRGTDGTSLHWIKNPSGGGTGDWVMSGMSIGCENNAYHNDGVASVDGEFTITESSTFELQMYTSTFNVVGTSSLGPPVFGDGKPETFSVIELTRIK